MNGGMGYACKTCGQWHEEPPRTFGADLPAAVAALPVLEVKARVERGSDQCVLDGEHYFILGNLDVPILGTGDVMRWTVWSTLSQPNFERAAALWSTEGRDSEPPYFGWLSNQIPGYAPSVNIKALVRTQPVGVRPLIQVTEEGHQLTLDQVRGISEARAEALAHAALSPSGRRARLANERRR
jgi:hypothetical protein